MSSPRITSKRQAVQLLLVLIALLLPFVTVHGNPFLRMDITRMTLFLCGVALRIDQFYLVLLTALLGVVSFLLITSLLGRVWCGWFCPQTVFNDLVDLVIRMCRKKLPAAIATGATHLFTFAVALTIALDLFCWFMPPGQVLSRLLDGVHNPLMLGLLLVMTGGGYLNLAYVKRDFCRSYCPYGRFQTALMDSGTLNLSFLEETRHLCLRCNACVRTCPMGIDIRNGFQIECISCGRCIDACRSIMDKRSQDGLIDYRFGTVKGTGFKLGNTSLALLVITTALALGLCWGVLSRNQTGFAVQRVATAEARTLADGTVAQPWRAIIGNRSETARVFSLQLANGATASVELLGQVSNITVAANEHREVIFMIHHKRTNDKAVPLTLQLIGDGTPVGTVQITP